MARMLPGTSTLLMRFPTTSRSRSRRMTSTSGSSGIVAPDSVGLSVDRAGDGRLFRRVRGVLDRQRRPRGVRGHLFGSFLGPTFTLAARLPLAEPQSVAELDRARDLGEHLGIHDRRPDLRELAFGLGGIGTVEVIGHDESEHGVSELSLIHISEPTRRT